MQLFRTFFENLLIIIAFLSYMHDIDELSIRHLKLTTRKALHTFINTFIQTLTTVDAN